MNEKTKQITYIGIGIALYIVISMLLNIPLIGNIRLDCGYIVYAVYLALFGWQGIIVGVVGCFIKGYISDGWVPVTWMIGQLIIGITCSITFKKVKNKLLQVIIMVLSVFLGIAIVSSGLSAWIFKLPLGLKIFKGCVASVTDAGAMVIGFIIADRIKKYVATNNEVKE